MILFGDQLCSDGHYAADKIHKKARNIEERREANREKAAAVARRLEDALALQQFLSDCDELREWIEEKMIRAQDETYRLLFLKVTRVKMADVEKYKNSSTSLFSEMPRLLLPNLFVTKRSSRSCSLTVNAWNSYVMRL